MDGIITCREYVTQFFLLHINPFPFCYVLSKKTANKVPPCQKNIVNTSKTFTTHEMCEGTISDCRKSRCSISGNNFTPIFPPKIPSVCASVVSPRIIKHRRLTASNVVQCAREIANSDLRASTDLDTWICAGWPPWPVIISRRPIIRAEPDAHPRGGEGEGAKEALLARDYQGRRASLCRYRGLHKSCSAPPLRTAIRPHPLTRSAGRVTYRPRTTVYISVAVSQIPYLFFVSGR